MICSIQFRYISDFYSICQFPLFFLEVDILFYFMGSSLMVNASKPSTIPIWLQYFYIQVGGSAADFGQHAICKNKISGRWAFLMHKIELEAITLRRNLPIICNLLYIHFFFLVLWSNSYSLTSWNNDGSACEYVIWHSN